MAEGSDFFATLPKGREWKLVSTANGVRCKLGLPADDKVIAHFDQVSTELATADQVPKVKQQLKAIEPHIKDNINRQMEANSKLGEAFEHMLLNASPDVIAVIGKRVVAIVALKKAGAADSDMSVEALPVKLTDLSFVPTSGVYAVSAEYKGVPQPTAPMSAKLFGDVRDNNKAFFEEHGNDKEKLLADLRHDLDAYQPLIAAIRAMSDAEARQEIKKADTQEMLVRRIHCVIALLTLGATQEECSFEARLLSAVQ